MKTDYYSESMMFERAASECNNIITALEQRRNNAEETARMNGEAPPDWYDLVIDEVKKSKAKFEQQAHEFWLAHKMEGDDLNINGCYNLLIAVAELWARDYEKALSSKHNNKSERITELKMDADNLVSDSTVKRIERTHKEFVKTAHDKLFDIIKDTEKAQRNAADRGFRRNDFDGNHMRTRCPLCGGGMFAKQVKSDLYIVKCSRCYLSEIVKVVS